MIWSSSIAKVNNSVHSQGLKVISLFVKLLDPNLPIDECLLRIEYTVFQNFIQAIFFSFKRQIRDTVNWIFSEQMLVYYINTFRDAFWPNGVLAPPTRIRSEAQSQETKQRAQQKLLENIPGEALAREKNMSTSGPCPVPPWRPLPTLC